MRTVGRETMRELDRRAIEEFGIPGLILMENAGRGATDVACGLLPAAGGAAAIVCGKGNNGGDGLVIARHLHDRGHRPSILLLGDPDAMAPDSDPGVNLRIARRMGLPLRAIRSPDEATGMADALRDADLVVDAVFGTGLSGEVRGTGRAGIEAILRADRPVLSVDIPSGLDADDGSVLGVAVRARATATFAAAKHGLLRGRGPDHAGAVHVVEISIPREILEAALG